MSDEPTYIEGSPGGTSVDVLYTNSYSLRLGNADISIQLMMNGQITHDLHLSFSLAKTLAQALSEVVQILETECGMKISTTKELDAAFKSYNERQGKP